MTTEDKEVKLAENRDRWWVWLWAPIIIPLWLGHGLWIAVRNFLKKKGVLK